MIFSLIMHLLFNPLRKFFLGIGGIIKYFLFQIVNSLFDKNYPSNIEFYLENDNDNLDKNGFNVANKNLFTVFVFFIILIIINDL